MAQNNRMYYAIQALGFAPIGTEHDATGYLAAKGVQSVGSNTNFNLEQIFQLGQIEIYENIEDIPSVEMTVEKVLDGYALIQHLATPTATSTSLAGRYNENQCMAAISYYSRIQDNASGLPLSTVVLSGLYVSSIGFTIPLEGSITESVSLVGNDKVWYYDPTGVPWSTGTQFNGSESPITAGNAGGIQRRENVVMASSFWPTEIPGISESGLNAFGSTSYNAHIQNINISTNLTRTELFELGTKAPYFRYADFPTEVTCSIETTATELGEGIDASSSKDNLSNQRIYVYLSQGIIIDLGNKNKLASVDVAGGDTGGGNVTVTYNYSNFNDLRVIHTASDPAGL